MTLYDLGVDIQVKLEAAHSADASDDLVARGRSIIESLDRASDYFEGVPAFRRAANVAGLPDLDQKAVNQAIAAFRAGLSRFGPAALQHLPASNLVETAKSQRDRAGRWVKACWKGTFAGYETVLERVRAGSLIGSDSQRRIAQRRAATLQAARGLDPIADGDRLADVLGGVNLAAWLTTVHHRGSELQEAVRALDDEREAMGSEVRDALNRAASPAGLPLAEMTAELLSRLRGAGVDDHLVVRRV